MNQAETSELVGVDIRAVLDAMRFAGVEAAKDPSTPAEAVDLKMISVAGENLDVVDCIRVPDSIAMTFAAQINAPYSLIVTARFNGTNALHFVFREDAAIYGVRLVRAAGKRDPACFRSNCRGQWLLADGPNEPVADVMTGHILANGQIVRFVENNPDGSAGAYRSWFLERQ
jgi:hypothetical protein